MQDEAHALRQQERLRESLLSLAPGPQPMPASSQDAALFLTQEQVIGNVIRLVKSHAGSRFVQQKLDSCDPFFYQIFFDEMKEHVAEIMVTFCPPFFGRKVFKSFLL
jgi:hypothetical protein